MSRVFSDTTLEPCVIEQSAAGSTMTSRYESVEVQTSDEFLPKMVDMETTTRKKSADIETLYNLKPKYENVNELELLKFLAKVKPIMLKELQPSSAYQYLEKAQTGGKIELTQTVETDSDYSVSSMSINCIGSSAACALEFPTHNGFCDHSSTLYFVSPLNGSKNTYSIESCGTAVLCHPHYPAILAVGMQTGEINLIKGGQLWALTELGSQHYDRIVGLDWILDKQKVTALVSASEAGLICVWLLKGRNSRTKILEKVTTLSLLERSGTISTIRVIPGTTDALIGMVSGQIIRAPLPYDSSSVGHEYQYCSGHTGPVSAITMCPIAPGLYASVGTDGLFCLRNNNKEPIVSTDICGQQLYDVKWSPHHPSIIAIAGGDRLYIMDVAQSTTNPILSTDAPGAKQVEWNPTNQSIIMVGCKEGKVIVFTFSDGSLDSKPGATKIVLELEAKSQSH